jgi:hypothetical protein
MPCLFALPLVNALTPTKVRYFYYSRIGRYSFGKFDFRSKKFCTCNYITLLFRKIKKTHMSYTLMPTELIDLISYCSFFSLPPAFIESIFPDPNRCAPLD